MTRADDLFVTHGAPTLAIEDGAARRFLPTLSDRLDGVRAIVVVSAHWMADRPMVGTAASLPTIYDFRGFPDALYRITYLARGAPDVARQVIDRLSAAGYRPGEDASRGLDHGAWVPLTLMRPEADIPVVPVSILRDGSPADHIALGAALAPLRDDGVAILATGAITHNLSVVMGHDDPAPPWVTEFADWLADATERDDRTALADYRAKAPHAAQAHPHDDHLMPYYVALGAGGRGRRIHASVTHGTLAMDAYQFA